jgi:SAM-dependent methyltransferase
VSKPHWSDGWYYKIELEKGQFTDGTRRKNLALTRKLLRNVDVKGKDCLDIGTAEAIIPVLLKRGGADAVVAYDRIDSSEKISAIQEVYQADFEYIHSMLLPEFQSTLANGQGRKFFDLVVFSGVLYHLFNPLGLLALVRGFCKVGGLFLLETCVCHDSKEKLVFNAAGLHGPNYFYATTAWLDYCLRMTGLEPLHVVYNGPLAPEEVCRMAILCRSRAEPIPLDENDEFMRKQMKFLFSQNFNEVMRYKLPDLLKTKAAIEFAPFADAHVGAVNRQKLFDVVNALPEYRPLEDETRLTLNATM